MKTCKTGCGKMKAGGSVKKVKKMQTGGSAGIVGMPQYGSNPRTYSGRMVKKGGAIKKYPDGGGTKESKKKDPASNENKKDPGINSAAYNKLFNSTQARDSANFYRAALKKEILTKGHSDKTTKLGNDLQRQFNKGKKGYDKLGNPKGKFGVSVPVKTSCKQGMVRGADGNCVMSRPKFKSGGSFGMLSVKAGIDKNPNPTAADRIAGAKMNSKEMKKGGSTDKKWIQKAINPAHKGFCTPETKKTCTPKRKALAHTLRKIARNK